jgi:repressor LexA
VLRYLRWLEDEGDIERWPGARGLKPLKSSKTGLQTREVPIVGVAPAGPLMTAEQNVQGWVCLPKDFTTPPSAKFFLLRVRGDSMNRARVEGGFIDDGDLVLVKQRAVAQPQEIVVAMVDGEATIKRLVRAPGYYILKPESTNPAHKPIIVEKDFSIQGIVIRVLKKGSEMVSMGD